MIRSEESTTELFIIISYLLIVTKVSIKHLCHPIRKIKKTHIRFHS